MFMAGNTIHLVLFCYKKHHKPFTTRFQQQVSSCFIIALIDHTVVGRSSRYHFVLDNELESDNRTPLVSHSNPVAAAFAFDLQI